MEWAALLGLEGARTGARFGHAYLDGHTTHNGEDVFGKVGTPIQAPWDGTVSSRWSDTTGNIVEVKRADGVTAILGHLASIGDVVKSGVVKAGQVVGTIGETGSLANPMNAKNNAHAHVMVRDAQGKTVDPLAYLKPGADPYGAYAAGQRPAQDGGPAQQPRRPLINLGAASGLPMGLMIGPDQAENLEENGEAARDPLSALAGKVGDGIKTYGADVLAVLGGSLLVVLAGMGVFMSGGK